MALLLPHGRLLPNLFLFYFLWKFQQKDVLSHPLKQGLFDITYSKRIFHMLDSLLTLWLVSNAQSSSSSPRRLLESPQNFHISNSRASDGYPRDYGCRKERNNIILNFLSAILKRTFSLFKTNLESLYQSLKKGEVLVERNFSNSQQQSLIIIQISWELIISPTI